MECSVTKSIKVNGKKKFNRTNKLNMDINNIKCDT